LTSEAFESRGLPGDTSFDTCLEVQIGVDFVVGSRLQIGGSRPHRGLNMTNTVRRTETIKTISILKPRRLAGGDRVGVISPAGPTNRSDLEPGLRLLSSSGFEVFLAPHVYDRKDYLAGDDEARLEDLHTMFRDPGVKAIFCARGGYGTLRLLNRIRYDWIKENPKIIAGYSDVTALLLAIYRMTGLITFHGTVVRELSQHNHRNWESLLRLLSMNKPLSIHLTEKTALLPGRAEGPLIGGNLSLICHLLGTRFLPSLEGCILFIEEKGEPLYRLDRMLTHLALAGQLNKLSGLIAGHFEGCGDIPGIHRLLMDMLSDLCIPMATGLPVGHGSKNLALPLGTMAVLDTDLMTLSITEPCIQG
jgi:muramoyltetrapeptide carboxypeptidase